jgi:hypothetical protein
MEDIGTKQKRFGWRLAGAAVSPFVVESGHLFFTRWPSDRSTTLSDWAGATASLLAGAIFVALLPLAMRWRVVSLLIYLPVVFALLIVYDFLFMAVVFQEGP